MMLFSLNDISIISINSADHRCIINGVGKSENILKNYDLTEARKNCHIYQTLLLPYIK